MSLTYTNHAPLIPLLSVEFDLSDVEAGLLTTALFLTSVPAYLGGGPLPERYGARLVNVVGMGLVLAGNVLFALAPTYIWLLVAKAVSGVGSGIAFNAGVSYLAGLYGGRRSHFGLGLLGAGYPLGSAIAIWSMPALILVTDWRGAFWISSLAIAVALGLWLLAPEAASRRPAGTVADAIRCGNCWWTSAQHAAGFGLGLAAATWITVYLLREFDLPLEISGLLGSLLLVLTVVARPIGGLALSRRRITSRALMRGAQGAILAGLALLAIPDRPLLAALVGAMGVGLGAGIPYAAVFNTAAASLPNAPGSAQGLAAVGGTVGATVAAPLIGFAIERWGFSVAWVMLAAVPTLALLATFAMRGEEDLRASSGAVSTA